jgi:protein-S-isoprenylcysteine O-methyltransferase Ste14
MKTPSYISLVVICAITHIIRTTYEVLKHKNLLKPSKISFVIIFTNMAVLWASWIALCSVDIYKINLPAVVNYLGLSLCVIGLIFFVTALLTIKTLETYDGDLITKGIYSKIRHPMYLGFILWSIGFPVYFGAGFSFFLSFIFIVNILFWRYLEEIELDKRFPSYKEYKVKTWF